MLLRRFHNQQGIALGPILFIIAILAIIAAAISAGSGGFTASTSTESAKAAAEAILHYADQVSMAVQKVESNGCSASQINFVNPIVSGYTNANSPSDNSCNVFDPNGGNVPYIAPSSQWLDSNNSGASYYGTFVFSAEAQLEHFNQSNGSIIMFLPYVPFATCQQINTMLGYPVTTTAYVPWVNSVHTIGSQKFTGSSAEGVVIADGEPGTTSASEYQTSGCLWFDNWDYSTTAVTATGFFYKVLEQQ